MADHREPREQPFLNDPGAYPEFSLLIKRQGLQHALRCGLHQHRTAALLALIALSIAASGADSSSSEWGTYLAKGVNAALLVRHFEGIWSALGCMVIVTATSLLVYPLYWACSGANQDRTAPTSRRYQSSAAAKVLAAAAPSAIVWTLAVHGAGFFRWGIASGLCVGLQCAALTLKSVSFLQRARPASASTAGGASETAGGATTTGLGSDATKAVPAVARGSCSNAVATEYLPVTSGKKAPPASSGAGEKPRALEKGGASVPQKEARCGENGGAVAETQAPPALTFGEFAFFLLLTPSLVCEPRLLVVSARRPSRVAAACSEFFHAALVYLAVHATCSAFFAPVMRVLAEALHAGDGGGGGWADEEVWAELRRTDGSGWWLHGSGASFSKEWGGCRGEEGGGAVGCSSLEWGVVRNVVVAACLGTYVLTPVVNYLMFYAFFHAVCLGSAELWGYPDRNTYGPWWLVMDDLRDYFRLWSAPVHRWLSKSIQRPMIEAGQREARRRLLLAAIPEETAFKVKNDGRDDAQDPQRQPVISTIARTNGRDGDSGGRDSKRIIARWWVASVVCSFLVSGTVHEAVAFVAMRRTFWPFNTFFLAFSASITPFWDAVFPVIAVGDAVSYPPPAARSSPLPAAAAAAGSGAGEAPVEPEKARLAAVISKPETPPTTPTAPDAAEKVRRGHSDDANNARAGYNSDGEPGAAAAAAGSGEPRLERKRPPIGSHRGWTTVVFYVATSMPLNLFVDYLVWQWWRRTHLLE